jgi:predicted negative regulator of RcsB-dependent stress response
MADDILLSAEEQDERARQWLKQNAIYIVAGIALGIAAIFGVNKYKEDKVISAQQASALFGEVSSKLADSNISDVSTLISELKSNHSATPYAAKAVLLSAKQYVEAGNLDQAKQELQWVVEQSSDQASVHAARLRLAKLEIYTDNFTAAESLLNVAELDGLDSHYAELKGDLAARKGDIDSAKALYREAIDKATQMSPQYVGLLENKINRLGANIQPVTDAAVEAGQ